MSPKNQIWHIRAKIPKYFSACRGDKRKVHEKSPGMVCRAEIPETGLNDWNVRYESEPPTTKRSGHSHTNENRRQKDYTWKEPHFLAHTQRVMIHPALLMGKKDFSNQNVFHKLCFSMCSAFARSSKPFWAQSSFLFWLKTGFFVLLAWKYGIMICLRQCWPLKVHLYSKCDLKHTSSSSELILLERWEDRFFLNVSRFALDQIYHVFGCL